jgi:signal transduction histidine kinase
VSLLQSTADIKQLTIEIDLLKDATIYADREMIEFVVRNVLHNAIKFSRTLSKIGIKVEKINEAIVLIIRDEGVGMSAEVLKSLTYQELGVSTKGTANEKGTGLGLVICREFITRNNGHLSIESVLNQGTTVSIKFPVSLD